MLSSIVGEQIERFENVSGTSLDDARFAVVTKSGLRIPTCRGFTIGAHRLDRKGKEKLLEHMRRYQNG